MSWLLWLLVLVLGQRIVWAEQSVTLTWSPSSDADVAGYKIYYGGTSGVYTNTLSVGNATSVTVSGLTEGATYYFSATTVTSAGTESAFSNEAAYVIPGLTNSSTTNLPAAILPPALDAIANVTVGQDGGAQTVNLTGISAGSGNSLTVTASSSNPDIVPNPSVIYASPASVATLTFAPAAHAVGTATVTVTIDNGDATNHLATQTFTVTVSPTVTVTPMPRIDSITNLTIYENSGAQTISLTGIASGITSGYQSIAIWAYSSDPSLLPDPVVNYSSPNATGTLTITPIANALGTAIVEVKINNGVANIVQTFTVTVVPAPVVSQPPTLDAVASLTITQNAGVQTVALTGISSGGADANALVVSAVSSAPSVIPTPVVSYSSPNNAGILTFAPVPNATGTATITVTVNNGTAANNLVVQNFTVTVLPPVVVPPPVTNSPSNTTTNVGATGFPTLATIANLTVNQGVTAQALTLAGISRGTSPSKSALRITAASSNTRLVAAPIVHYAAGSTSASLTFRLIPANTGTATITVTVNNGAKSNNIVQQTFTVTVVPPAPPTLDPIANVTVTENAAQQTIQLTGIAAGPSVPNATVRVTAASSNARALVPKIQYTSPGNSALLTFTPAARFTGVATVTVTVNNGNRYNGTVKQRFSVTVTAPATNKVASAHSVTAPPTGGTDTAATLTPVASAAGEFDCQVTGVAGGTYVVQSTPDLIHWTAVETNAAPFLFRDSTEGVEKRFYRAYYLQP